MPTMTVREAVEEYGFAVLSLSTATQKWYLQKLSVFIGYCEDIGVSLDELKASHVRKFVESLRARVNPQTGKPISSYTVHGYTQVVKGFLSWCSREDDLEASVSDRMVHRIELPRVEKRVIEVFTTDQVKALFAVCDREYNDALRARDKAILSILLDTGIRASELVDLTIENVVLSARDGYLLVHGKGNKWREVGLGREARTRLHRYMTRYRRYADKAAVVFLNRSGSPLTPHGLHEIVARLGRWARVVGVRCSPHTFRHTYAMRFLQATGDVYRLSRLLGHTSVSATEVYLRAVKAREARSGVSVLDTLK